MLTWQIFHNYLMSARSGAVIRKIARLCISGVGVGVMALIIVVSIMNGFNDTIRERLLAVKPHLVVSSGDKDKPAEKAGEQIKPSRLKQATRFSQQDVIVRTLDGVFGGAVAKGLERKALDSLFKRLETKKKNALSAVGEKGKNFSELELGGDKVIMGQGLARSLGVFAGDQVLIMSPESLLVPEGQVPRYERVTVESLVTTEVSEVDSKMLYYELDKGLRTLQNAASLQKGIEVRLKEAGLYASVADKLRPEFNVETWPERDESLFFALKMEKAIITTFLSLSALITSFSIITVLVLLMSQKRRDIGILMAMGLAPTRAQRLFTKVGLILSGLGLGGGVFFGVIVCLVLELYPVKVLPDIYYDATIPATVNWWMVFVVIIVAFVIAFLSSWIPSKLNVRESPAQVLRGK